MKRAIIVVALLLAGCQVYMSKEFAQDLAQTAEAATVLNALCQDGDPNTCSEGLQATTEYIEALNGAVNGGHNE